MRFEPEVMDTASSYSRYLGQFAIVRFVRRARWPWVFPPTAPTDPYVRTLAHTVPLTLDSPCSKVLHARIAILGR
jgi:hypothetical protein